MILRDVRQNTRRQFLWHAAWLVPAVGALRLSAEEPFDSLPASVWKNARNNGLVMIHRPAPSELSWQTQIVKNGEPGEPLIVAGRVSAPDGPTPAEGVTVYAYNTDAEGYLRRKPHGVSAADLWLDEDECRGGFELRTIHPGCYPGMRVPAHVHFVLWGGGYPLQWTEELKFEGGRYITPALVAEDAQLGEFRTIQRLSRGNDGVLRCAFQIRLRRESNFH
jgi:protocatechuate 3,4-dioxygenase beta subunit